MSGGHTWLSGVIQENTPGDPRQPLRGLAEAFVVMDECIEDCMSFAAAVELHAYTVRNRIMLLDILASEG